MSWRGYEFNCPDCGVSYLRQTNIPTICPNANCKGNYMELYAVVETEDFHPFGALAFFRSRRIIDNSRET